jgi:alkylation response protein AidB-like acyl-CoA dehydrogenase
MPEYSAPIADLQFLQQQWLGLDAHYQALGLLDFDSELAQNVLDEGAKFAQEQIASLNQPGDEEGCRLENGAVFTPNGFAQAYQAYVANGWNAMLGDPQYGGSGLPYTMAVPVHECLNAANLSWRLTTMLTESAVLALTKHGSDTLKTLYLEKLISGAWTGTMNLTEPQAGSDLSLLSTKAVPHADGHYCITGTKIFITGGDHDWTDNIIHMVLARLPDAPEGVKGISLFLVPKIQVNADGTLGAMNQVSVGSLEHKMGIKASPTCVMNYDEAVGYLVGEANNGLACMFTMMNDARFQVGLEGLGTAERAYQGAKQYALERLQSRAPEQPAQPSQKADPIIEQPDVKRMLLTQKSLAEGSRALALWYAKLMDVEKYGQAEQARQASQAIAFLTPITKAFFTDIGSEAASLGIQVLGGHGYIREWGMEQLLRDNRVAQIYEGTNGIQAADLIGRKLTRSKGEYLAATEALLSELCSAISDAELRSQAETSLGTLLEVSQQVSGQNGKAVAAMAHDYLQCASYHVIAILWCSVLDSVSRHDNQQYIDSKRKTGEFYLEYILPRADMHKQCMLKADVVNTTNIKDFASL